MLNEDKKYKVKKADLLAQIKKNREKHVYEYQEAVVAYRNRALQELQRKAVQAKEGQAFNLTKWPGIIKPKSHERDYARVMGLLEMAIEDTVEITPRDYDQYVLDQWDWKDTFSRTVSNYSPSGSPIDDDDE